MAAIALSASYMKSMGVVPGQRLEVEVNGSIKPVYAYATASADEKGVDVSLSAAKELGAKVGDKIIIRQLSEAPPQISEK
jgi:hypothetical protein